MNISLLEKRIDGVLNYIENNPTSDPNTYEMNDIMFEMADIGYFGHFFEKKLYGFLYDEKFNKLQDKFYKMMELRLPQLISEEQGLHADKLHQYFKESLRNMATLNRLANDNVEMTKELFSSMCGVNLYIHQRTRDLIENNNLKEEIYDNEIENIKLTLNYQDYKDNPEKEVRPEKVRDAIVGEMYDEIQKCYKKTIGDILTTDNKLAIAKGKKI